jgi:hypothetical protein
LIAIIASTTIPKEKKEWSGKKCLIILMENMTSQFSSGKVRKRPWKTAIWKKP